MVVLKKLKKLTKNSHKTQVILLVFIFLKKLIKAHINFYKRYYILYIIIII